MTTHPIQRRTKKPVLTLLWVVGFAWIILLGWALSLWIYHDFTFALHTVQRLSVMQTEWVTPFAHPLKFSLNRYPILPINQLTAMANEHGIQLHQAVHWGTQSWLLFCLTGQVLLLKLGLLIAALPLLLLAMLAGLIDGLSQRAIRTASLGRESTYVFHKSIPIARKVFLGVLWLWLSLPIALPPSPIFLTLSVLLGLVVSMSASRFKKYL